MTWPVERSASVVLETLAMRDRTLEEGAFVVVVGPVRLTADCLHSPRLNVIVSGQLNL